jgi:predicted alpha/beta-hydrolase family hydrolase
MSERIRIDIAASEQVSAIVYPTAHRTPAGIRLILAHGAGASQSSGFMVRFATALAERGFPTLTFNFLYSEQGRRAPDRNDKLEACYRKVIEAYRDGVLGGKVDRQKLVIGGKSMGGRIASQVAATDPSDIAGLVLLGYPLHPPGQPDKLRTKHLAAIRLPALFVQGTRDTFGTPAELEPHLAKLGAPVHLYVVEGGDHSFKVPKQGLSQEQVYNSVLDEIERWLHATIRT